MAGQTYTGLQQLQKMPDKKHIQEMQSSTYKQFHTAHEAEARMLLSTAPICLTHCMQLLSREDSILDKHIRKADCCLARSAIVYTRCGFCHTLLQAYALTQRISLPLSMTKYKYRPSPDAFTHLMSLPTATPAQSSDTSSLQASLLTSHVLAGMMPAEQWSQVLSAGRVLRAHFACCDAVSKEACSML